MKNITATITISMEAVTSSSICFSFASHTILRLISSALLYFGKATRFALLSASATPGNANGFTLLSLLRMGAYMSVFMS